MKGVKSMFVQWKNRINLSLLILSMCILPALSVKALSQAGNNKETIEGNYEVKVIADGQGTLTVMVAIKRNGDKLVTEAKNVEALDITGIQIDGENVTLAASFQGNPFDLPGKIGAEGMGGKWAAGGFGGTWSARKVAAGQASSKIPGQFAEDFVAGNVPAPEEIAALEKAIETNPDDFRLVRKLGKGYFFQVFGEARWSSAPKAEKLLTRALELNKDDAETTAYMGSLVALKAGKNKDTAEREKEFQRSFEMLKKAQQLGPRNGAVLAVTGASFLFLPDSFNAAPLAAQAMENIRQGLGPMFKRFSHHGQQRILLTQGQAYAKMGRADDARKCFDEALAVDQESVESHLIKAELAKLDKAK
jgi:hypothetical protein